MTRVLVIDDNEDFAELIRHFLQADGFSVAIAHDGRLGMEIQRRQPAEIIVTDIFMPTQDGVETIAALRNEFPEAKVIAMTGRESLTNFDALRVADELGAVMTFKKPFDIPDLVAAIRKLAVS
jgi:DNA-binding response OmpR family regulator